MGRTFIAWSDFIRGHQFAGGLVIVRMHPHFRPGPGQRRIPRKRQAIAGHRRAEFVLHNGRNPASLKQTAEQVARNNARSREEFLQFHARHTVRRKSALQAWAIWPKPKAPLKVTVGPSAGSPPVSGFLQLEGLTPPGLFPAERRPVGGWPDPFVTCWLLAGPADGFGCLLKAPD